MKRCPQLQAYAANHESIGADGNKVCHNLYNSPVLSLDGLQAQATPGNFAISK
jgi:hypothetical protein